MKAPNSLKNIIKPFVSPVVYDFWASKLRANASWDVPLATVIERRVEARDAVTFVLRPNGHFEGFASGQHVNVTVEVEGVRYTRSYSITSVPQKNGPISMTVKRVEGGKVSTELCQHTRVGDVLELGPAFGEMTIPESYSGDWLLLAAGSGITPLMSIVRALTQASDEKVLHENVTLLYWARTRSDLCFFQELRALAASQPRFHLHFALTREHELLPEEIQGRPSLTVLEELVPNIAEQRVYACGAAGFVDTMSELLADRVRHFSSEAFTPSEIPLTDVGTVSVKLKRSNKTFNIPTDKPILSALEEAGLNPAYGCRMGICNTCACAKFVGATLDILTGAVSTEQASALRICVSSARSNLELDL